MNLIEAPDNENMVCRLINEEHKIEMGIFPVLFGFRVRGGELGAICYEIDWCCGDSHLFLEKQYNLLCYFLECGITFKEMPSISEIKPGFKDRAFLDKQFVLLCRIMREEKLESFKTMPIHKLPAIPQIKQRYSLVSETFTRVMGLIHNE